MAENVTLKPNEQRYIIAISITFISLLFLFIINGGGLTADWLRIYENMMILITIFVVFAIITDRRVFDFNFSQGQNNKEYRFGFLKLDSLWIYEIGGVLLGIGLAVPSIIGILSVGIGINPTILSVGSISSQFVTQFFAPFIEETLISGIILYTLLRWFKIIKIGPIILAIGTIITFIASPTTTQISLFGVVVIVIGLIFTAIYPLNQLSVKNRYASVIFAITLTAFLFAGLHGYYLNSNPSFNSSNIIGGYIFIFAVDFVFLSIDFGLNTIYFSIFAHMTYDGIQYLIQNPPITSTNLAVFFTIFGLYFIFSRVFFTNPDTISNIFGFPTDQPKSSNY